MKKGILFLFFGVMMIAACRSGDKSGKNTSAAAEAIGDDSTKFTTIQWLDSIKDFGTVVEGQKAEIIFRYKNTGDKPLVIQNVTAGCGCTVPEYTQEAVMPGGEGFVKAIFNSSHQSLTVQKSITVTANTKGNRYHKLEFYGDVTSN